MCALATFLSRKSVRVIGDYAHDCFVMHGMCWAVQGQASKLDPMVGKNFSQL